MNSIQPETQKRIRNFKDHLTLQTLWKFSPGTHPLSNPPTPTNMSSTHPNQHCQTFGQMKLLTRLQVPLVLHSIHHHDIADQLQPSFWVIIMLICSDLVTTHIDLIMSTWMSSHHIHHVMLTWSSAIYTLRHYQAPTLFPFPIIFPHVYCYVLTPTLLSYIMNLPPHNHPRIFNIMTSHLCSCKIVCLISSIKPHLSCIIPTCLNLQLDLTTSIDCNNLSVSQTSNSLPYHHTDSFFSWPQPNARILALCLTLQTPLSIQHVNLGLNSKYWTPVYCRIYWTSDLDPSLHKILRPQKY